MKRLFPILTVILLMLSCLVTAQNPTASISTINAQAGTVLVPLNLTGFTQVINSFTLRIQLPESQLSFISLETVDSGISADNITSFVHQDILSIAWFDISSTYIPDGEIFKLRFSYSGGQAPLFWSTGNEVTYGPIPVTEITFENGGVFPVEVGTQTLQINFLQGYTWFSMNVNPGNMTPNSLFSGINPCYDDRIIGQNSFALYTGSSWFGALTTLSSGSMYRMKLCSAQTASIEGETIAIQPIALTSGYTWIGYQPQQCMTVAEAMSGLSPGPSYNDRIIGQQNFALYNGSSWVGSISTLCPGNGYVIRVSNPQTLTYPATTGTHSVMPGNKQKYNQLFSGVNGLPHTMMMVARIATDETTTRNLHNCLLLAKSGNDILGVSGFIAEVQDLVFLSIAGAEELGPEISFCLFDTTTSTSIAIQETVGFEAMQEIGDPLNPFILHVVMPVGLQENISTFAGKPYPNPFFNNIHIPVSCRPQTTVSYRVLNVCGFECSSGSVKLVEDLDRIDLSLQDLKSGIYSLILHFQSDSEEIIVSKKINKR